MNALSDGPGAALMSLPTGAGKTFTAMQVALALMESGIQRVLWLAPQHVLLNQALSELRRTWWSEARGFDLSLQRDPRRRGPDDRVFTCSTIQAALKDVPRGAQFVVVDECHYIESNEFGALISELRSDGAMVLGLTATPGRTDSSQIHALSAHFGDRLLVPEELGADPVAELQRRGVYAELGYDKLEPTFELDTERVARKRGPGDARCRVFAHSPGRLDATVHALEASLTNKDRALVFCYSIGHCHVVAAALHNAGIQVGVLGSAFGDRHNGAMLRGFQNAEPQVLVNAKYVAVGADLPMANVAVLTLPVGSPIFFEQVVGRVARGPAVGGTKRAIVLDFDSNYIRHSGVRSYVRFRHLWKTQS